MNVKMSFYLQMFWRSALLIILVSDICYEDSEFYNGKVTTSIKRNKCLPSNASIANEEDLPELKNYCTDLQGNKKNHWCFTENGIEACDVPLCFSMFYIWGSIYIMWSITIANLCTYICVYLRCILNSLM